MLEDDDFSYEIKANDGRLTVTTAGDLDIFTVERLDQTLEDWLAAPCSRITFDCKRVDFVDSSFLRFLTTLTKRVNEVRIINASRTVLRILEISGLDAVFL